MLHKGVGLSMFIKSRKEILLIAFADRFSTDNFNRLINVCSKAVGEKMKVSYAFYLYIHWRLFSPYYSG